MSRYRKMVETRRVYRFEELYLYHKKHVFLNKPRSVEFLRAMAADVWVKHGRKRMGVPRIKVVDGAKWSECYGLSEITLATSTATVRNIPHNTVDVLLHELVHAMGFGNKHGRGFMRKYIELLIEYGGCHEGELKLAAGLFKIKH